MKFSNYPLDVQVPYTDTLLAPSDAPLSYVGCAILLDGQNNWPRRAKSLLISARHKELGKVASQGARIASGYSYLDLKSIRNLVI